MQRNIFEVYAKVVDANGAYSTLSGYPKVFDSRNYNNNIEKALQRAKGEFHETFGAMCKRDDRKLQMVLLMSALGQVIERQTIGGVPDDPDPIPEPEPEGEGEGEGGTEGEGE